MRRFKFWVAGASTRKGEGVEGAVKGPVVRDRPTGRADGGRSSVACTPVTHPLDQWAREHSCPTCSAVDRDAA